MQGNDESLVEQLCAKVQSMNKDMGIPSTLKEFGIEENEFKQKLPAIAQLAVEDACTGSNPRPITAEQMEQLLTCTYYGTGVAIV